MKELCFDELLQKYGQYEDWYRGGCCYGNQCPKWGKCRGNEEFDKLVKHAVTESEMEEAIKCECKYGVFDREKNYY